MTPSPLARLTLRSVAAVTLLAQAAVHGRLWAAGYRTIDVIGPLFLAGVVASVVLAVLVLVRPSFLALTAAIAVSVGQVAGLAGTKTIGLFGFMSAPGLSQQELTAVSAEVVAAIALAALLALPKNPKLETLVARVRRD